MSNPGFMSMRWLRMHIKEIIWATVILFLLSLFVVGYGTTKINEQNEEKQRQNEAAMAAEDKSAVPFPPHMTEKLNMPVIHVSYPTETASLTSVIDVKTLWQSMKSLQGFDEVSQMPKGIREYYMGMFKERAINTLVTEALADMYATAVKIKPNFDVKALVDADRARITPAEFDRRLRNEGITSEEYGKEKIKAMVFSAIQQQILKPIPFASATEDVVKNFYEENKHRFALDDKISFNHLLVSPDDFSGKTEVAEEAIKEYYDKNTSEFLSGNRVKVSHILLNFRDQKYLDTIPVSEADLREAYENNRAKYVTGEEVKARHILIKTKDKAELEDSSASAEKVKIENILNRAKSGEDFAELAREFSEDSSANNGGDLGQFGRGTMVEPFENAAFNAKIGDIVGPVRTQFGYHIIKVEDKIPATDKSFEDVKADLIAEFKITQAELKASAEMQNARNQIFYSGKQFNDFINLSNAESAKNKGLLPVFFNGKITKDYDPKDAQILRAEIADFSGAILPEIEKAVFSLKLGEVSEIVKTIKGFHLLKVEEILEPIQLSYSDEVKQTIKAKLDAEERNKLAAKYAEQLKKENPSADVLKLVEAYTQKEKESKISFEGLPYSKNPGFAANELFEGLGLFSDNGRTYVSEIHTALANLLKGDWKNKVAGPFKTQFGWHFIEVTDYENNRYESFDLVKDSIRQMLVLEANQAEVQKFYEENKEQFAVPASREVRQIIASSEKNANEAYDRLNKGEIFVLIAKSYSIDGVQAGTLTTMEKGKVSTELAEAVWALTKGQYTKPVKTPYGYVIALYEGNEVLEGTRPLNEVEVGIRQQLRQQYSMSAFESFFKGLLAKAYVTRNDKLIKEM